MGICSSCLGLGRRTSDSGPSESSHLLGDAHTPHYGGVNAPSHHARQVDPEELRRQRDALERICAATSDKLIPVSRATPAPDGSKMASEYPTLFNERFPALKTKPSPPPSAAASDANGPESNWLHDILVTEKDDCSWERVVPLESGSLTFRFGDLP